MLAVVERNPDIYLDEIQEELYDQYGVSASISSIWRTVIILGLSNKRVRCRAMLRAGQF